MSFTAPIFYVCLAPAAVAYYWIPGRLRALYLLALSWAFVAMAGARAVLLMIGATALSWAIGLAIAKAGRDRPRLRLIAAGAGALVLTIVAFKAAQEATGLLLPLGLSYYSFKLIAYLVEVYWDDEAVERDPVVFFLFPAFFPQIVSGPIERPEPFFRQMREIMGRGADEAQIEAGFRFILGGLMLKLLIGDRLAEVIDSVDSAHGDFTRATMIATVALYTLQLYADFAGYTNIALGIGKLFGVEGPPNFNAPFAATNIQEMWRRWHMSLTSWLTDYLFTPLSMSLRDLRRAGLVLCIMLNMTIIGLWHGFTLNYLVFGLLHGVFLSATMLALLALRNTPARGRTLVSGAAAAWAGRVLTFALMSFSQIFFHSQSFDEALSILAEVAGVGPAGRLTFASLGPGVAAAAAVCAAVALYHGGGAPGARAVAARLDQAAPRWLQYGGCAFLLLALSGAGGGKFIYGQF